jgi:hypothetical protein
MAGGFGPPGLFFSSKATERAESKPPDNWSRMRQYGRCSLLTMV